MPGFVRSYKVRFEDCDSAGIVFYPNYFLMLNRLVEDWFAEALAVSWGVMHRERRLGVPMVQMQVAFRKASRLDDVLDWTLEVSSLGTSSFTLKVGASCNGEERLGVEAVLVAVNLVTDGVSSCEIPADMRAGMESFLVRP